MHEDPSLVLLLAQLRSWSLQTVKGAMAVPGRTEFNVSDLDCSSLPATASTFCSAKLNLVGSDFGQFVLHMSRVLCRMGALLDHSFSPRILADLDASDYHDKLQAAMSLLWTLFVDGSFSTPPYYYPLPLQHFWARRR